jgi:hypothetical protein
VNTRPTGAYPPLRQQAEDILFTQCDGCTACQQRAKAVARAYLALIGVTEAHDPSAAQHKPFTDDGVTYCGWDGHDGCGEVWPCSKVRAGGPRA